MELLDQIALCSALPQMVAVRLDMAETTVLLVDLVVELVLLVPAMVVQELQGKAIREVIKLVDLMVLEVVVVQERQDQTLHLIDMAHPEATELHLQ
jgi:hypothetical protein